MNDLLAAIVADPDDDAPRRVYADALLDRGEPLGELINIQLDLARGGLTREQAIVRRRRERELLRAHHARWTAPLAGLVLASSRPIYRRGFIDEVDVEASVFAARGEELFEHAPVLRGVRLDPDHPPGMYEPPRDSVEALVARFEAAISSPALARLRGLDLDAWYAEPTEGRFVFSAALLVRRPALPRLRSLTANGLDDASVAALVETGVLAQLERLSIDDLEVPVALRILDATPHLRALALPFADDLPSLLRHPIIAQLAELRIESSMPHDSEVKAILASADFPMLRTLDIPRCDEEVARTLASSPRFANLVDLGISHSPPDISNPLADPPRLDSLRILRFHDRHDTQVVNCFDWPVMKRLELVDLRSNKFGFQWLVEAEKRFDGVVLAAREATGYAPSSLFELIHPGEVD